MPDPKIYADALQILESEIGTIAPDILQAYHDGTGGFQRIATLEERTSAMRDPNFLNLLIAEAGDVRVLLLRIADCLAEMRELRAEIDEPAERTARRKKVSTEASLLYAPLAHKLGLYNIKRELEDLALKYLEAEAYYHIKEKLNATRAARDQYVEQFCAPIHEMLQQAGISYHLKARTKSIHSIWQKMQRQHCAYEGVYDLFAIRIIIESPSEKKEKDLCWQVFSLITNKYESSLKRLRDWLTVPKPNGYESLHITVRGPEDKWVEVQIRSERMDEIAEHGLAAHWRYKGVKAQGGGMEQWLLQVREALEQGVSLPLGEKRGMDLYVFSPKGDLIKLPAGATVLDYAYHVHSHVGNHCVGAVVSGRNVPIRQTLASGQTVEIITSANQQPKQDWLNIVVSHHAKAKIKQALRDIEQTQKIWEREEQERKEKRKKPVANPAATAEAATVRHSADEYVFEGPQKGGAAGQTGEGGDGALVIDRNVKGLDFQLAPCCNPVFGDEVFGFVTVSGGVKIHRSNCPNAPALKERFPYRVLPARWAGKSSGAYPITLHVVGQDDLGIVTNITSIISKEERVMLRSISIESHDGLFTGILTVLIEDTAHLSTLVKKIRTVKGVKGVSRL
ncbi:MAG: TGS domain-containing protein [Bacteroidaceae bacterium]|nr:TGS domain-containing protein [Bacteroidaceae bacterium]